KVGWRIIYLNYFIIWVVLLLFWIDYKGLLTTVFPKEMKTIFLSKIKIIDSYLTPLANAKGAFLRL
ncbi:hypothetical protein, partial [Psychrobacter sp. Pi2-52]|uniref:hypothetical protein n=1 Tax=Psychrobacter sp. Pi2-52 TaxID=2774133 RepID=UPI001F11CF13